jgi:hypothetical protein
MDNLMVIVSSPIALDKIVAIIACLHRKVVVAKGSMYIYNAERIRAELVAHCALVADADVKVQTGGLLSHEPNAVLLRAMLKAHFEDEAKVEKGEGGTEASLKSTEALGRFTLGARIPTCRSASARLSPTRTSFRLMNAWMWRKLSTPTCRM